MVATSDRGDISIGVGAPLTGPAARLGTEMKNAAEMAVEERNSTGGIMGRPVSLVIADDEGKSKVGAETAERFCVRPDVLGVIGHYNSDVTLATSLVYHRCGVVMITPVASNVAVTERGLKNVFRYTNRDDETAHAIAEYLVGTTGKRHAVIFESDTAYGRSMAEWFQYWFSRLGGQVHARRKVKEGQQNFDGMLHRLPEKFDLIFYGGSCEGAGILKAMRKAGYYQLFAAGDGCWDAVNFLAPAKSLAAMGEGVLVLAASVGVGRLPYSQEFAERYSRRFGPIVNYALNAYDSTRLLLAAIDLAAQDDGGIPRRAGVLSAVRQVPFQGIAFSRPVEWTDTGDNLSAVTVLNVVRDGQFREIAEISRDTLPPHRLLRATALQLQPLLNPISN